MSSRPGLHILVDEGGTVASRIEDYAMIGDCETAALVSKTGSIDWLCLPRFDAPACFAALLGTSENGMWSIAPTSPAIDVRRRYLEDTLVLETDFFGRVRSSGPD